MSTEKIDINQKMKDRNELEKAIQNYDILNKKIASDPNFINSIDKRGLNLLHLVAFKSYNYIKIAKLLLENGLNPTFKCNIGRVPLHYACRYGKINLVKILIEANPSMLNERDSQENTPLDLAIREQHTVVVEYINKYKSIDDHKKVQLNNIIKTTKELKEAIQNYDILNKKIASDPNFINSIDNEELNLLHLVAMKSDDNIEITKLLLENGLINSTLKCDFGRVPLHYACRYGKINLVKILIEANPSMLNERDSQENTPLDLAIREKHTDVIEYINKYISITKLSENTSLVILKNLVQKYIELAKVEILEKVLLDCIYNQLLNKNDYIFIYFGYLEQKQLEHLLVYACKVGHVKIVERLIKKEKVDPNSFIMEGTTQKRCLEFAIQYDYVEIAQLLLNYGAKTVIRDNNQNLLFGVLHTALCYNSKKCFSYLLKNNYSMKLIDELLNNKTFIKDKDQKLIEELQKEISNRSKFLEACKQGKIELVKKFLENGIYVDSDDSHGRNALFHAVSMGHDKIVELLLDNNATICSSENPRTSIQKAFENYKEGKNHFNILKLLCAKELNVEIKDEEDKSSSIILAKMITTLLYKSKRYDWESNECKKLRSHIKDFAKHIKDFAKLNPFIVGDNQTKYQEWVDNLEELYDSYLSSDSDSEEEILFKNGWDDKSDQKLITISDKILAREGIVYLDHKRKAPMSKQEQLKEIARKRMAQFNIFWKRKQLQDIRNALTDGKNHFKPDGSVHLTGKTTGEGNDKGKTPLSPIHNSTKIAGLSPLLDRSRIMSNPSSPSTSSSSRSEEPFIATYRGDSTTVISWNKDARKAHRERNDVGQAMYSAAVLFKLANVRNFRDLYQFEQGLTEEERANLQKLKQMQADMIRQRLHDLLETEKYFLKKFTYDNLGELLQEIYTNNYDLCSQLLRSEFFIDKLSCDANPFLSTAETSYHALRYSYGIKFYGNENNSLDPRWRKDGRAGRPYSGKTYIMLNTLTDLKNANRILELLFQGKIDVGNVISAEREISFYSHIEEGKIIYEHIAKYPSFHRYKEIYKYKYGIDRTFYNNLCEFRKKNPANAFKNILAEYLCAYHEMRFVQIASEVAQMRGRRLAYLDYKGKVGNHAPTEYCSPSVNISGSSPVKKDAEKAKNEKAKRTEKDKDALTLDIPNPDKRNKLWAQAIINIKSSKQQDILPERFKNLENKQDIIEEIKRIEKRYTSLLHYSILKSKEFAQEIIKQIPKTKNNGSTNVSTVWEIINLYDKYGNTPLHLALLIKDKELSNMLIERGADQSIINNAGFKCDTSNNSLILTQPRQNSFVAEEMARRKLDFSAMQK